MEVLVILIPVSLILGGIGLAAFFWTLTSDQYEDPEGDARRILSGSYDDAPKPEPPAEVSPEVFAEASAEASVQKRDPGGAPPS